MTPSQFAFMVLGLLLGLVVGISLFAILRSTPNARREVRVTVTPNAVARRRATTLADDALPSGPARGGPGDRRQFERDAAGADDPVTPTDIRTPVPAAYGPPPFRLAGMGAGSGGISIQLEPDPMMLALRASAIAGVRALMPSGIESTEADSSADSAIRRASVATMPRPEAALAEDATADASSGDRPAAGGASGERSAPDGPAQRRGPERADAIAGACDEPRRVADERCLVATRAREGAQVALDALSAAQRSYDDHVSQAEAQAATADPRAVRAAKEAAQQAFRVARSGGKTREDVETAAREWLTEINRINLATREASGQAERHRLAASELATRLERLSVEADAARISAESADEACVAAREAVAACQEAATILAASGRRSAPPAPPPAGPPAQRPEPEWLDEDAAMGSRAGEDAVIVRLLRGDREALNKLIGRLGGDDPAERRRWQTSIGQFLEALVARSMEASAFDFPTTHPFWGPLTRSQARDVAAGLSSLGYRHDGFGSWADDHMPTQRDLSLAVGYAGLDPFRIRHWPSETEMKDLLREVTVAADEYVWEAAGALTLGQLVSLLGRRADGLTELWNEWGVVRPLLLAAD